MYTIDADGQIIAPVAFDGRKIVYFNLKGHYEKNSDMDKLVHDLHCVNPEDMYFDVLRDCVYKYKCTEEGRNKMCEIMQNLINESNAKSRAEGKAEGSHETTITMVKEMLKNGASLEFVCKCSHLPYETVLKLQSELLLS
ncbi:MAG: hypothetical protein LUH02_07080 [Erysipelotrichaceae bacterium]|nr:hypothetical protein [Erysipelotrichaceae bacterium]